MPCIRMVKYIYIAIGFVIHFYLHNYFTSFKNSTCRRGKGSKYGNVIGTPLALKSSHVGILHSLRIASLIFKLMFVSHSKNDTKLGKKAFGGCPLVAVFLKPLPNAQVLFPVTQGRGGHYF